MHGNVDCRSSIYFINTDIIDHAIDHFRITKYNIDVTEYDLRYMTWTSFIKGNKINSVLLD